MRTVLTTGAVLALAWGGALGTSQSSASPGPGVSARSGASAPRICPEQASDAAYIDVVNHLDAPIRMSSTITDAECKKYWSGVSNPSRYNGRRVNPGDSTHRNLRLESARDVGSGFSVWRQQFKVGVGGRQVLLDIKLRLHVRYGKGGHSLYGWDGTTYVPVKNWPLTPVGATRGTLTISRSTTAGPHFVLTFTK